MSLDLCGSRIASVTVLANAKDPTQTHFLRARMRAESERRWRLLGRTIRQAIIERDMLGLSGAGALPHTNKTDAFAAWLRGEITHKVLGIDGGWTKTYIQQAAVIAQKRATDLAGGMADPTRLLTMQSLATNELKGICEAAQQQIVRSITHSLMANVSPTKAANQISAVVKTMINRTRAMDEYVIAKTHSAVTLSSFRNGGITTVGIVPEKVRRKKLGDAKRFIGPGSVSKNPSRSTIHRIKKAHKKLQSFREVDVLTAEDDDVCFECQDIADNGPYHIDEAESLIPAHAFCRCSFLPVGATSDAATVLAAGVLFRTPISLLLMRRADTGKWSIPAGHF